MSSEFRDTQRKKRVVAGTLSHSGAKERNGTKMSGKKSQQMLNSIFRKPSPTRHTIAENISLSERHFGMLLEPPQTANTREEGERGARLKRKPPVMLLFHAKNYSNSNFSINSPQKCASDRGNPLNHYSQSSCTDSANKISYSVCKRHKKRIKALGGWAQAPTLRRETSRPPTHLRHLLHPSKTSTFLCSVWRCE